jgi:AcrR family transcriptional regulator
MVTSSMPPADPLKTPPLGLRERKKAQTRVAIQRHALALIREHGYTATTMEQVAAAADISPSTLYRYFPTKEDLILTDDYDPLLAEAFRTQPPELSPLEALRAAILQVMLSVPEGEMDELRERTHLTLSIPEVRARAMDNFTTTMDMFSELFAERSGLPVDDYLVRITAGTIIGAMLAAQFRWTERPGEDIIDVIDQAMGILIDGPGVRPSARQDRVGQDRRDRQGRRDRRVCRLTPPRRPDRKAQASNPAARPCAPGLMRWLTLWLTPSFSPPSMPPLKPPPLSPCGGSLPPGSPATSPG